MKRCLILTGALISSLFYLCAQQNNFINYNVKQGLPNSSVLKIMEDERGYLWLGTNGGGACRFDGREFTTHSKNDGLSGNIVWEIFSDSKGRLWMGTDNGVTLYDGISFDTLVGRLGLDGITVFSITEDDDGHVWLASLGMGLYRVNGYDGDSVMYDRFTREDGMMSDNVSAVCKDHYGRIWAGTINNGVNLISEDSDEPDIQSISALIPARDITSAATDSSGNVWFGSQSNGIFKVPVNADGSLGKIVGYNTSDGLGDDVVWSLCFDDENRLWAGTVNNGVSIFDGQQFEYFNSSVGLPGNYVIDVAQDRQGNMWFGMVDKGLVKFLGYHFSHYSTKEGLPDNNVYQIAQDHEGNLWVGTFGGGLLKISRDKNKPLYSYYNKDKGLLEDYITSVCVTGDDAVWIGYNESGISRLKNGKFRHFTEDNGLYKNDISCMTVDNEGRIWYGTTNGLSFMNQEDPYFTSMFYSGSDLGGQGVVKTIMVDSRGLYWVGKQDGLSVIDINGEGSYNYDEEEGLADKNVFSLAEDARGDIWIGTSDGGLYKFYYQEKDSMPIRKIAGDELLSSNLIYSLIFYDEHNLVVGTDKGMDRLLIDEDGTINRVFHYDENNGFFNIENNLNAIYKDNNDNIWMGTVNGLTRYDPALERVDMSPPLVHLTDVLLRDEQVDWTARGADRLPWFNIPGQLSLPHSENSLKFEFDGISYSNPVKVRYRVMCEGIDDDYGPVTDESDIDYRGLSPGHYTLKILAESGNGVWTPEPLKYPFAIRPPFYLTWWFISIMVLLIGVLIVAYIKYRERQLIKEKRILEQKVEDRTAEIREKNRILSEQNTIIEANNREIKSSIRAAKRIQDALLPSELTLSKVVDDYFILFKPRDIVSGDFYWVKQTDNKLIVVAADCTGHGVPGAFMSLLGMSYLNDIVEKGRVTDAGQILNRLRQAVIDALHQSAEGETKEGMDMALVTFDLKKNTLQYAGANNPLYLIRNKEVTEVKADRMPVAIYAELNDFRTNEMEVKKGDCIYLFSDGFPDQFGGPRGKKFKYKPFKELLLELHGDVMEEQKKVLDETLETWRGDNFQVDDIVVMGIKY